MAEKFTFVQLAHEYEENKYHIDGWYASEKLDGQRCFWDGGISRGIPATEVPYANTEKDDRLKVQPIATGLWSRGQKVIHAPAWFLDKLPPFPLDGELFINRKCHQLLRTIVAKMAPLDKEIEEAWRRVTFWVFDSPLAQQMFPGSKEMETDKKHRINRDWMINNQKYHPLHHPDWCPPDQDLNERTFSYVYATLRLALTNINSDYIQLMSQIKLSPHPFQAKKQIADLLIKLTDAGAEGLIIRHPGASYIPKRTPYLLKVKRYYDSEATITGYVWGRKTDKGSKLLGLMGTVIVKWTNPETNKEVTFEIGSGFTENERVMTYESGNNAAMIGSVNHGKLVQQGIFNPKFPIGSKITFQYRELSDGGVPKEATYLRKAD